MRPWYRRWWGVALLAYLAVNAVLGTVFLVANHRAREQAIPEVLRAGGFTPAESGAGTARVSAEGVSPALIEEDSPAIGAAASHVKLTIVEFSDFECPYCREAFPIIRAVAAAYADRGVRYVYRHFPVDAIHTRARAAAESAACAAEQGKFWAYHDKLFQNAPNFDPAALARYARQVGLDQRFDVCVGSGATRALVQRDAAAGAALGVRGTPTWFFITQGDERTARRVEGVITREAFTEFLDHTLARIAASR